jgi:hypothetical protein
MRELAPTINGRPAFCFGFARRADAPFDEPSHRRVGETIAPSASSDQSHLKHRLSLDVGGRSLQPQTPQKNPNNPEKPFQRIRNADPSHTKYRSASGAANCGQAGSFKCLIDRNLSDAMGRLEGKIAVIPGANNGISLASAKRFVAEGAHVYATGCRQEELNKAVQALSAG